MTWVWKQNKTTKTYLCHTDQRAEWTEESHDYIIASGSLEIQANIDIIKLFMTIKTEYKK